MSSAEATSLARWFEHALDSAAGPLPDRRCTGLDNHRPPRRGLLALAAGRANPDLSR